MKPYSICLLLTVYSVFCFGQKKKNDEDMLKNFVELPSDSFSFRCSNFTIAKCGTNRRTELDIQWLYPDSISKLFIEDFFISKHEVTNQDYLEFLYYLKKKQADNYSNMLPDTLVWRDRMAYCEPYVDYYLRHPAYRDFPVVGVSYMQALAYCNWLTQNYHAIPKRKYKRVEFTLPTLDEWTYAASGGNKITRFGWNGAQLMNNDQPLANFLYLPQHKIRNNSSTTMERTNLGYEKYETAPVQAYLPNKFKIYNMQGNVSEYILNRSISMGGSYSDTGFHLQNYIFTPIDTNQPHSNVGFRVVMHVIEK